MERSPTFSKLSTPRIRAERARKIMLTHEHSAKTTRDTVPDAAPAKNRAFGRERTPAPMAEALRLKTSENTPCAFVSLLFVVLGPILPPPPPCDDDEDFVMREYVRYTGTTAAVCLTKRVGDGTATYMLVEVSKNIRTANLTLHGLFCNVCVCGRHTSPNGGASAQRQWKTAVICSPRVLLMSLLLSLLLSSLSSLLTQPGGRGDRGDEQTHTERVCWRCCVTSKQTVVGASHPSAGSAWCSAWRNKYVLEYSSLVTYVVLIDCSGRESTASSGRVRVRGWVLVCQLRWPKPKVANSQNSAACNWHGNYTATFYNLTCTLFKSIIGIVETAFCS